MSYFPYAFQPLLLATAGIVETAGTATLALTAAQLGVISSKTNQTVILSSATTAANTPKVYLAQGSMSANDNLGGVVIQSVGSGTGTPFHGGYKASRKSREIDPKHITKFYYVGATAQTKASVSVTITGAAADFENNQSLNGGPHSPAPAQDGSLRRQEVYRLRLDLKGSPILRVLNRNEYVHFDASTKCMADGTVDRYALITQWRDAINSHPIVAKFVTATAIAAVTAAAANTTAAAATTSAVVTVTSATGITVGQTVSGTGVPAGTLVVSISGSAITTNQVLNVASTAALVFSPTGPTLLVADTYSDTVFSDPVYSRTDFHEYEGIQLFASVVDERQVTCSANLFAYQDVTVSKQGTGYGETVLQKMILENEYRQEPWHEDTRLREVLDDTNLASINRFRKYGSYYLQYTVQRRSNSSSLQDDDQILLEIVMAPLGQGVQAGGTRSSAFEAFIPAYAASAGNTVTFVDMSSVLS